MASSSSYLQLPLLLLAAVALLISPASSQTCRSQTFNGTNNGTTFARCLDLPTLRAYLHWTYDPSARPNPTLSIAFIAPPAAPDGWVAWALNPTQPRMVGSQSLVAFRNGTDGSMVVRTYNITTYASIAESPIDYEVLSRRAESSDGVMRIFATLALPAGHAAEMNQVWQVGAAVRNGVPARHDFAPANLGSTGTLHLGSTAPAPAPGAQGRNDSSGGWRRVSAGGLGLYGAGLVLLGGVFLGF